MNKQKKNNMGKPKLGSKLKHTKVNLVNFHTKTIQWLVKTMKMTNCHLNFVLTVLGKILRILRTRGVKDCIRYSKEIRSKLLSFILSGCDPKKGLPKVLRPLKPLLLQDNYRNHLLMLTLTATYVTRSLRLRPNPSFATIERAPGYDLERLPYSEKEIKSFLKRFGVNNRHFGKIPRKVRFKSYHMTSKSGPNGQALFNAHLDYELIHEIKDDLIMIGGSRIATMFDLYDDMLSRDLPLENWDEYLNKPKEILLRKLACISDKEGKTREIAILDYWSQTVLKPLHDYIFGYLKRHPADCTHDQTKNLMILQPSKGSSFHSIDLKSATDQIPIQIVQDIFSVWFGHEFANSWKQLLVRIPFDYKGRKLSYKTGNPMGAYTSFCALAISQHFFVFLACLRASIKYEKCPYMVLGDDIVIANDKVAYHYKQVLMELDIPISEPKSHVSPHGFEFAKRIVYDGVDISPFPISALYERRNNISNLVGIIYSFLTEKGWQVESIPDIVISYLGYLGFEASYRKKLKPKIILVVDLITYLTGKDWNLGNSLLNYVNHITKGKYSIPIQWHVIFTHQVVIEVLKAARKESAIKVEKVLKGKLDPLSENILLDVYEYYDEGEGLDTDLFWVPYLSLMGKYNDLAVDYYLEDVSVNIRTLSHQLRKELTVTDIPLTGEAYYRRHRDVVIVAAFKAADLIDETLRKFKSVKIYDKSFDLPWANSLVHDQEIS